MTFYVKHQVVTTRIVRKADFLLDCAKATTQIKPFLYQGVKKLANKAVFIREPHARKRSWTNTLP